jgi:hypothetical protein
MGSNALRETLESNSGTVAECFGDLALVEKTSIKLALNYPDLVHTKAQMRSQNVSRVHLGLVYVAPVLEEG